MLQTVKRWELFWDTV